MSRVENFGNIIISQSKNKTLAAKTHLLDRRAANVIGINLCRIRISAIAGHLKWLPITNSETHKISRNAVKLRSIITLGTTTLLIAASPWNASFPKKAIGTKITAINQVPSKT